MKHSALTIAALSSAAFANAAATETKKAGAPKAEDRVAPIFTEVRTDIAIPVGAKRGQKSDLAIKLEELPVNGSIGLTNKTKKQISSTISKMNSAADNQAPKIGVDGQPVTKIGEPIKDATGVVVGHGPSVPVYERIKEFQAFDMDPKKDPEKATVRIFRIK